MGALGLTNSPPRNHKDPRYVAQHGHDPRSAVGRLENNVLGGTVFLSNPPPPHDPHLAPSQPYWVLDRTRLLQASRADVPVDGGCAWASGRRRHRIVLECELQGGRSTDNL